MSPNTQRARPSSTHGLSRVPAYHSGLSGLEEAGMAVKKTSRMGQAIRKHALSFPETAEEFPWGESAFKVKGKTFVFMHDGAAGTSFSIKVPSSRDLALSLPGAEPTHYGLGAKGWVTVRPDAATSMHVLRFLIDESYRAIAPKKVLATLPEPPQLYR